jgi:hypothetical protein
VRVRTVPFKTISLEEICRRGGFENETELRRLLLRVPVDTRSQREDYERWSQLDGTKIGLLRLISLC